MNYFFDSRGTQRETLNITASGFSKSSKSRPFWLIMTADFGHLQTEQMGTSSVSSILGLRKPN
jgi:hypothetical protein